MKDIKSIEQNTNQWTGKRHEYQIKTIHNVHPFLCFYLTDVLPMSVFFQLIFELSVIV